MIPTNKNLSILHPYVHKKGGAVKMMILLSKFLQEKNNTVTFYTFNYDTELFADEDISFKVDQFYSSKIGKLLSFFIIAFKVRKSDYIIIGNSPMHFVGVLSKVLFGSRAKLIWWNHHYPWYYSGNANIFIKLKRIFEKLILKRIDIVVSNSQYLQKAIQDIYKRHSEILYPVLAEVFLQDRKRDIGTHSTIFTYGRWGEGKNIQLIFQTYENLKNKVPNLVLKIGGEGNELDVYKVKYENNPNLKFLGVLDNCKIIEHSLKSNVFLFPSLIDSFGLVLIESLALGNPVVCYDRFGAREIVQDGVNGYLVKSENEFIDQVYTLLTNSELQNTLSIAGQKTAQGFTMKSFEDRLSQIF